jgi:hypothetical protein
MLCHWTGRSPTFRKIQCLYPQVQEVLLGPLDPDDGAPTIRQNAGNFTFRMSEVFKLSTYYLTFEAITGRG